MSIFTISDTHFRHGQKPGEKYPRGIIKHSNRPYPHRDAMDEHMISVVNEYVKPDDWLIHNGDFLYDHDIDKRDNELYVETTRRLLDRINCKNITLVCGNHDRPWINVHGDYVPNFKFFDLFCWQGQCHNCGRVYEYYKKDGTWLTKCLACKENLYSLPAVHPMGFELKINPKLCQRHNIPLKYEGMLLTFTHYALRTWNRSHHNKEELTSLNFYGHSHGHLPGIYNSHDIGWDVFHRPVSLVELIENMPEHNKNVNPELLSATYNPHHDR